jgi:hypothetical protein
MLRLLAQREQGYEDMASLMGLSVEEVRVKVKEALAEIDSDEAPAQTPSPAAVAPPAPPPPEPAKVEAPAAVESPAAAKSPPATPSPAPASKPGPSPLSKLSLPSGPRRWVEWIGGAAIVVLVILFATGTIDLGGGGSDSNTTTAGTETTTGGAEDGEAENTASQSERNITKAVLSPVNGGDAKGAAVFGRLKKAIVMQVEAAGLDPSPQGSSYTIWLYKSPKLALRVGSVKVGDKGGIGVRIELPAEAFAAVATRVFDQIDISLTSDAAYKAEVAKAKAANRLPEYTGTDVLRGPITGPVLKK